MKRLRTRSIKSFVDSSIEDYDELMLVLVNTSVNNENYRKKVLSAVKDVSQNLKSGSKIKIEIPENEESVFYPEIIEWLIDVNAVAQNHGGGVITVGCKNMDEILNAYCNFENILESFRALNLSPFENLLLVSEYISSYEYKAEEEEAPNELSRELINVLNDDLIVCVGYAKLMCLYLNRLGVPCMEKSMKKYDKNRNISSGHRMNTIHLVDKKYGIDGYYHTDACWNSGESGLGFFFTALPIKTRNSIFSRWKTTSLGLKNIDSGFITKDEFTDIIFDTMYEDFLEFIQIKPNKDVKFDGKQEGFENFAKFIVSESENNSTLSDLKLPYLDFGKLVFWGSMSSAKVNMDNALNRAISKNPNKAKEVSVVHDAKLYLNPETRESSVFYDFYSSNVGFDWFYTRFSCFGRVIARLKEIKTESRPIELKKYVKAYSEVLSAQGVEDLEAKKRFVLNALKCTLEEANRYNLKFDKEKYEELAKYFIEEAEKDSVEQYESKMSEDVDEK